MRSSLTLLLPLLVFAACPAAEEPDAGSDAGTLRPDAGVPDAGPPRCPGSSAVDGGAELELAYGYASLARGRCLEPGQRWTLTVPARTAVNFELSQLSGPFHFEVRRGAVTLLDAQLAAGDSRKGWFVAGTAPVTLTLSLAATATATADFYLATAWTMHPDSGNVRGVPVADTRAPAPFPAQAPLMASSFLDFSLAEAVLRAADDAGCDALTPNDGYAFYAFELDAGTHRLAHLSIPVLPDFEALLVDDAGATLAAGTLGNELRFSLDAGQRVAFGFRALDAGASPTCSFDGGALPEHLFTPHRSVYVPEP